MMTIAELWKFGETLPTAPSVLLKDGRVGLLIGYPHTGGRVKTCLIHHADGPADVLPEHLSPHEGRMLVEDGADIEAFRQRAMLDATLRRSIERLKEGA
jgi:hypothetical protein